MTLSRPIVAEFVGTAMLLAIIVGSGIMGERLAGGNDAVALLGNTMATGAGLVVLIHTFAPISGAHFNPAVTLVVLLKRETTEFRRDPLCRRTAGRGDPRRVDGTRHCSPSRSCRYRARRATAFRRGSPESVATLD